MAVLAAVAALAIPIAPDPPSEATWPAPTFQPIVETVRGHDAGYWYRAAKKHRVRYLAQRRRTLQLKRTLLHTGTVTEALDLACVVYGSCSTLWRRARCESTLDADAQNPSGASGLLQFLPSTWAGTPFGRFSIYSPYANALAAGWMFQQGRGDEWECR